VESGDHFFEEGYARLKEAIQPLIKALKKYRRALRIGVNQGSLSSRMMERYGDSPFGMVNSALEMAELFGEQGFEQLVISLKSSNPIVVQKAYRLLVEEQKGKAVIPMHLGVTEAGAGLMGRIKSLAGIGPLLKDGIGDTIRVSLTEDSANEILFANEFLPWVLPERSSKQQLKEWQRPINHQRIINSSISLGSVKLGDGSPFKIGKPEHSILPETEVELEHDFEFTRENNQILSVNSDTSMLITETLEELSAANSGTEYSAVVIKNKNPLYLLRKFYQIRSDKTGLPVGYLLPDSLDYGLLTQLAAALSEGLLDFCLLQDSINPDDLLGFLYLLQATRSKILVTDYITCPSCGRTLFDIQTTTARIKEKTSHLKGVKIGIMGCIVNGPGEMADADFGYVGSGVGKIDLYFGQERISRGINEEEAVDSLIGLIKQKGYWRDN
jgi:(E)-4-hydroxy-3-methylbut-2-enyl-diphosphate synthase